MGKNLTPKEREQRALEAGFDPDSTEVSGERVCKELEDSTLHDYENTWKVWVQ
jgi:hypothetical protein